MTVFSENIRYMRVKKGLSQEAIANELQVTRSKIASYEDGRAEPSLVTLARYADFFRLPVDALIKNDLTKARDGAFIDIGPHRVLFPLLVTEENEDVIEVVPLKASAGYLKGYADPDYVSQLPRMQLPFIPVGKHRAFPIKGDSMEPWVSDGAFVVARFLDDVKEIRNGFTYVVVTREDGLSYKRVFTDKMPDGLLILQSDNGFYRPFEVHLSDVLEVWEYTCKIDLQAYKPDEIKPENIMRMMRSFNVELQNIKDKLA